MSPHCAERRDRCHKWSACGQGFCPNRPGRIDAMARRTKLRRFLRFALLATLLAAAGFTLYLDFRVRHEFEGRRFALPARIFARPLELHAGLRIPLADVVDELTRARATATSRARASRAGTAREGRLEIALRPFVFWDGAQPARASASAFEGGKVPMLQDGAGQDVPLARLEPLPIGGIYPAGNEDRVLVRLNDVPKHLVEALIAVEDRSFRTHHGFDPRGLARAARQHLLGEPGAGRQHHHAAAGEELLPHARAHPPRKAHRAGDGGAARDALRARRRSSRPTSTRSTSARTATARSTASASPRSTTSARRCST